MPPTTYESVSSETVDVLAETEAVIAGVVTALVVAAAAVVVAIVSFFVVFALRRNRGNAFTYPLIRRDKLLYEVFSLLFGYRIGSVILRSTVDFQSEKLCWGF